LIAPKNPPCRLTCHAAKCAKSFSGNHPAFPIQIRKSEFVIIYLAHAYAQMSLVTFMREVLEMPPEAQAKALKKVRQLEQSLLAPLDDIRAPP
jgi:hypothetical protein